MRLFSTTANLRKIAESDLRNHAKSNKRRTFFSSTYKDSLTLPCITDYKHLKMSKLRNCWDFICRHRYLVAIILFSLIVGFLDPNSYYNLYKQKEEIKQLEEEIGSYRSQYEKDTRMLKQLDTNPNAMEKIARERYFMKKPNEDIYVFSKQ